MPVRRIRAKNRESIDAAIKDIGQMKLRVGWFASAKYETGTPVAMVAAAHEFGVPQNGLPPRPFMRPTIAENRDRWLKYFAQQVRHIFEGESTVEIALNQVGLNMAGKIKQAISKVTQPPLKTATVKAKMRKRKTAKTPGNLTKPLVDTGLMISTVTHEVSRE